MFHDEHRIVEQHRDLSCRRCDRLGVTNSRGDSAVGRTERSSGESYHHDGWARVRGDPQSIFLYQ